MFQKSFLLTSYVALATLLNITAVFSTYADHSMAHNGHTHHKTAIGIHGMAILTDGHQFFASHMPLANSIHAHQVVFSFTLGKEDSSHLKSLLANNALISLMPERFDLMRLMSGELTHFKGTIFEGHFERGGNSASKDVTVHIDKMLLKTNLISNSSDNGKFYLLNTGNNQGLLVHRIVENPSFDQILRVSIPSVKIKKDNENQPLEKIITVTQAKPVDLRKPITLKANGRDIILRQSLYLETQDFQ